jgi:mannose/cellobiose epimerase-like protein (N-acyl-D-glucosamine 2-epimerase family)
MAPRRKNRTCTLLEAIWTLHSAAGEPGWRMRSDPIATPFDQLYGALREYFDLSSRRAEGNQCASHEPGHHRVHRKDCSVDPAHSVTWGEVSLNGAP